MKQNIENHNSNGDVHGYQQWYTPSTNKLWLRGNWKNGEEIGYVESNWKGFQGIGDIATTIDFYIR
jgi:hypothetical protein